MSAAQYALFAEWRLKNQDAAKYLGVSMAGIVGLFAIAHWTSKILRNFKIVSVNVYKSIQRPTRRIENGFKFASVRILPARVTLALLYFAVNAALIFYDHPQSAGLNILGKRLGWMTLANICVAVFLGLKNTPLSPIVGQSYESINVLHRCVGVTTIILMILHAAIHVTGLKQVGALNIVFMERSAQWGPVAGVSMILVLLTAVGFVRKRFYELFYITHLVLVALILIAVGLHQPELAVKAVIATIVAASMWFADMFLRLSRWIYYGVGNFCTITPLPCGATRVVMHRQMSSNPGSHAFLCIPGIRAFERHPFTLISQQPAEFVIKARDGFTRKLYEAACKSPGARYRASIEGPYGHVPGFSGYDKIVLIAGGSGITFALSMALEWTRRKRSSMDTSTLDLVWCVRDAECIAWFQDEIDEIRGHPRASLSLHVSGCTTSSVDASSTGLSGYPQPITLLVGEKEKGVDHVVRSSVSSSTGKSGQTRCLTNGRPNVTAYIHQASESLPSNAQILVAACGPTSLLTDVRKTVEQCTSVAAPTIEVYTEEFSI